MKDAAPVVKTHHPFGDPAATQYHRRDELLRELQRRETNEQLRVVPLPPVSGEIQPARPVRHTWTVVAIALFACAIAACLAVAFS
jgi:hypothetical protein